MILIIFIVILFILMIFSFIKVYDIAERILRDFLNDMNKDENKG